MEAVTLIVDALAAGASAGAIDALKDNAKESAKSAYARLRDLVQGRFSGNPKAEMVLAEYEADPVTWKAPLTAQLTQSSAADDAELVAAARAVLDIVDQTGKYNVRIKNAKGVQIGDGNFQVNKF
jgi:RIP homotypic interaction motif